MMVATISNSINLLPWMPQHYTIVSSTTASHSAAATALLFLLVASFAATGYSQITYFRLLLVWPGGHCSTPTPVCCRQTNGWPRFDFILNRLIAYGWFGPSRSCSYEPFSPSSIEGINKNLTGFWPSLKCPSSDGTSFWESAWNTDGKCSGFLQTEYFTKALQLRRKANVLEQLDFKDIQPTKYRTYKLSEVERAINEGLKITTATIECGSTSSQNIKGIHLCADSTATNIVDCPSKGVSNCASTIVFDPFTAEMLTLKPFLAMPNTAGVSSNE